MSMVLLIVIAIGVGSAAAAERYVAPNGDEANVGTWESPWSLAQANRALQPGDTAILLPGTYTGTPIAPAHSGEDGKPIAYRAAEAYQAVFRDIKEVPGSNGPTAIYLTDRAYVEIEGIKVVDVKRWIVCSRGRHIAISDCYFERGSGWINARFEESGDGIHLINNYFNEGTDLVSIDGGNGHLVEGNFFGNASHTGLVLLGVQRSVVRKNRLLNRRWRAMEVESRRKEPYRLSEYNLIEENIFEKSSASGIQYAGNRSILRRNIFHRNLTGMNWANYLGSNKGGKKRSPEAWHDESNRFYHNVTVESGTNDSVLTAIEAAKSEGIEIAERIAEEGYGMTFATNMQNPKLPGYDSAYGDNLVVNNIFFKNANTMQLSDKKGAKAALTTQIAFIWNATPAFGRFYGNNIFGGQPDQEVIYFGDAVYLEPPEPRNYSIENFEKRYPEWAKQNIDADPKFANPDKGDFRLRSGSPCIDKGIFLTKTRLGGEGKLIEVEDALFFSDGYGVVKPDIIRVGKIRVAVVTVDYDENTIAVDRKVRWKKGIPVTLDYQGKAPDIGAFEFARTADTAVGDVSEVPESFAIEPNSPNPFNPSTIIAYSLPRANRVTVQIYDVHGRENVATEMRWSPSRLLV